VCLVRCVWSCCLVSRLVFFILGFVYVETRMSKRQLTSSFMMLLDLFSILCVFLYQYYVSCFIAVVILTVYVFTCLNRDVVMVDTKG
jgi:hypothetical protein